MNCINFVGNGYEVFTAGDGKYGRSWTSVMGYDYLTFSVRACADVRLALATVPQTPETAAYHVIIADTSGRSLIQVDSVSGGEVKAEITISDLLSCDSYREFWVGWANKTIQVCTMETFYNYISNK